MSAEHLDVERLIEDIQAEARDRRVDGVPGEIERVLDKAAGRFRVGSNVDRRGGRLKAIVRQSERLSYISPHVPTVGRRPYLEPVKKGIQGAVRWYVGAIVSQIQEFIRADLHAMRLTADAIETLEERVRQLEARVAELQERTARRPPT
jgi:hypothetical protein